MKQKLLLLFSILAMAVSASAQDGNNVIYYEATEELSMFKYSVFGADYNSGSSTFENGQGKLVFEGTVTTIGNGAFNNCTGLTSITIPNTVTTIGESAFYN